MAFFLLTFIPFFVHSQNVLQIEKRHTKVMLKYTTGDDVTFKLKQSDQWITSTLNEINYDQQIIRFTNLTVVLDSIAAIRSHKPLVHLLWVAHCGDPDWSPLPMSHCME
jgi:hypothetical protein